MTSFSFNGTKVENDICIISKVNLQMANLNLDIMANFHINENIKKYFFLMSIRKHQNDINFITKIKIKKKIF